jgi:hypothetical protein
MKAHLTITGGISQAMGKPNLLKDVQVELFLHEERITMHCVRACDKGTLNTIKVSQGCGSRANARNPQC